MKKIFFSILFALVVILCGSQAAKAQVVTPELTSAISTTQGTHPWVAYMSTRGYQFTGTYIAPGWILTCGHCLESDIPAEITTATLGGVDRFSAEQGEVTVRGIRKITFGFNAETGQNDFALLQVPVIPESAVIKILPLYTGTQGITITTITTATLVGWGRIENGKTQYLMAAKSRLKCLIFITRLTLNCTDQDTAAVGLCMGDSGSPLEIETPEGTRLQGIGIEANPCDEEKRNSVFVRVQAFTELIEPFINRPIVLTYLPSAYGS